MLAMIHNVICSIINMELSLYRYKSNKNEEENVETDEED